MTQRNIVRGQATIDEGTPEFYERGDFLCIRELNRLILPKSGPKTVVVEYRPEPHRKQPVLFYKPQIELRIGGQD